MLRFSLLFTIALIAAVPFVVAAQDLSTVRPDPATPQGENMKTPPTWVVRADDANAQPTIGSEEGVDIWFVNMTPGWHVTSGPSAIYYHPTNSVVGDFTAHTKIHLFDPEGRREAYGMFFGGQALDDEELSYDYFLLRNSGEFLIKRRTGAETDVLVPWTTHDAIQVFGPESDSSVPNELTVAVGGDEAVFLINGEEAARLPRSEVATEGIVGLRLNHHLNVHVEDLSVTE